MNVPQLSHSQNYLHSASLVKRLIRLTSIGREDLVIEIGPGKGIITRQLAGVCRRVIGVDYDAGLYAKLKCCFGATDNVVIHHGDFLSYPLPRGEYKIFANIPFNITSAILAHITKGPRLPADAYLIMQEEAARRYAGLPYSRESLRSLLLKPWFELSIAHKFANTDFSPVPGVDIVFLRMHRRPTPLLRTGEYGLYKDFLCFIFSQRGRHIGERMRLIFTGRQIERLAREWHFSATDRPCDLSFKQWLGIFSYLSMGVSANKQIIVRGAASRLFRRQNKAVRMHRNRKGAYKPPPDA